MPVRLKKPPTSLKGSNTCHYYQWLNPRAALKCKQPESPLETWGVGTSPEWN